MPRKSKRNGAAARWVNSQLTAATGTIALTDG